MSGSCSWKALARVLALAIIVGTVLVFIGCGSAAFREGRKAEEQKDYDTAVVDFQKALRTRPNDSKILIAEREARNKASLAHLERGRALLKENRPDDAAGEFQKAISVDPSNQAAGQELRLILAKQVVSTTRRQKALREAMEARERAETAGGVQLKPLPQGVIPVIYFSANSKQVFRALGKMAGLNVVFYYEFEPKQISLDLSEVTIGDALRAAAAEAGVFWKAITPNTILVIPDTPSNRRRLQSNVLKTVYLQNPLAAQDRMAILTAVKQVIGLELKAFDNPETNSIVLDGSPSDVEAAEHLIRSLDRGQPEVLIDVSVLEMDKDRMRDLGLSPVPISGDTMAALSFSPPTTSSSSTSTPPAGPTLAQLGKLTTGDFQLVLPGVIANALLTDSRSHILENPQLRVTAGEKATLKIGEQYPYATGSFGIPTSSVVNSTTSSLSLLSNTQFNYKDVGVNLIIQPYVAADGDVVLHAQIQISSVGTPVNIGGVSEPVFTQREVDHVIRLKEGQTSLLGGLIQTQTNLNVSGLPGLADIPIVKYLFSTQSTEVVKQEVLIMMTPHVIGMPTPPTVSASNVRATNPSAEGEPQ
jgi:general secretion pathway protein D